MPFNPEDLSTDLVNRATGSDATGGIAAVPKPLATHNTGNPYLAALSVGLPIVGGLVDMFTESPRAALEKEILKARKERLSDLRRQAKGKFTPAERREFQRANEAILNRVVSNIAQRGLDTSGAALEVLAQKEQAPLLKAQQRAQAQLSDYELKTFNLTKKLAQEDDGFVAGLGKLTKYFSDLQKRGKKDPTLRDLNSAVTSVQKLIAELTQLRGGKP